MQKVLIGVSVLVFIILSIQMVNGVIHTRKKRLAERIDKGFVKQRYDILDCGDISKS